MSDVTLEILGEVECLRLIEPGGIGRLVRDSATDEDPRTGIAHAEYRVAFGRTAMAVLCVESFGSPRGFARTARRVGRRMPVLTVIGGRSAEGQCAAASHIAAASIALAMQEALFGRAGIVVARSLGELVDVAALLSSQPLPAGRRVAIVSNAGGAVVLAADACTDNALTWRSSRRPLGAAWRGRCHQARS